MLRFFLVSILVTMTHAAAAETVTGKVVAVSDGATITVSDLGKTQHRIRLAGIDAPESRQEFGPASKRNLSSLLFGRNVAVEWHKLDRYGRILGKVTVSPRGCTSCTQALDAGLAQLEAGLAWWDREYRREQSLADQGYYEYAEFDARIQRRGLWRDPSPIPPWEWRKRNLTLSALAQR